MKIVAYQFAETLAAAGIKRIYGVVGDRLNGLTDALRTPGQHRMGPSLPRRGVRLPARPISARAEQPITTRILYRRPFLISMKQTVMASMLNQGGTTSGMSSKSSFRTTYDGDPDAMRRPPEGAGS